MAELKSIVDKSDSGALSVKELFYKYIRFLPWFLLSVALALLGAFMYLRYASNSYSASGNMLIKSQKPKTQSDKVEDILTGGNRTQNIQAEIEVLKSRPLMTRVVNKLGLQFNYTAKGRIKDRNVYGDAPFVIKALQVSDSSKPFTLGIKFITADKFRVNNDSKEFTFGDVLRNEFGVFTFLRRGQALAGSEFNIVWHTTESMAAQFASLVGVQPKGSGTGILIISLETSNPRLAADIVNTLMVQYDSLTIEENNYSTDQMLAFIDGRLDTLKSELDRLQNILLDYRQRNNLIDVVAQSEGSFDKITETDKEAMTQQLKLGIAEYLEGYLKDKGNQFSQLIVPSSLGLEDLTLNELVNGYNKAQLTRRSLLESNIPPAHPAIREAETLIEQQRQSVMENLQNIKATLRGIVLTLRGSSQSEEARLKELPFKTKELVELERQVSTKLALYTLIEGKREEAAISRASTISNSSIIQLATVSNKPVKPNKQMIQLIAILVGLGLPALIIFLSELFNDKITARNDIEKITDVPIIGEIGHSFSDKTLVVSSTSRSMVAEQFRTIRTNLDYVLPKSDRYVILVTSSFSGEGKSFVSTNMGAVLALTGKKAIVLEFDIRKPKVLAGLNLPRSGGISNFLAGKAEIEDLILNVPGHENLFVLPCGPIPPNPSELLLDSRIAEVFARLKPKFDIIIIDTAPVGMVSDAMTLAKFADCTLYLVRQGHTYKKQISLIDEIYHEQKLPRVSIIVNDVKAKHGYGYYGYGRYGYGAGYGNGYAEKNSYYEEEKEPKSWMDRVLSALNPFSWFRKRK